MEGKAAGIGLRRKTLMRACSLTTARHMLVGVALTSYAGCVMALLIACAIAESRRRMRRLAAMPPRLRCQTGMVGGVSCRQALAVEKGVQGYAMCLPAIGLEADALPPPPQRRERH